MSTNATTPAARVPGAIPVFNRFIRRAIGAGLPMGPNTLITIRGRTSGMPHTFPIALLEVDGRRYVQSPFGEVNWVRNLRASGEATLGKGRQSEDLDAVEIAPDEAGSVFRAALGPYFRHRLSAAFARRFFNIGADATLEDYIQEARRHPMFELRPRA